MTMASGVFGPMLRDEFDASDLNVDLINDDCKMELVSDTYTPDFTVHDEEADITNEVTGTGIAAGGQSVDGESVAIASGVWTYDITDEAWTGATGSSIRGRVIYDNTVTTPLNLPLILATTFGSDFSVTAGTFTVQENASGVLTLDYTP